MCGRECPSDDLFIYFLSFRGGSVMCLVEHRCNFVLMSCTLPTSGGPGGGGTGTGPDW